MAVVSFADVDEAFNLGGTLVSYSGGGSVNRAVTNFSWLTSTGTNDIDFDGTGFSYSGVTPTGGTVTRLQLDLGNDSATHPELLITGLSFNLAQLAPVTFGSLTADQENDLIWRVALAGDDTINLGTNAVTGGFYLTFAGDGRNVTAGTLIDAGDDTITGSVGSVGSGTSFTAISGDVLWIDTLGTVYGGNDTMTVTLAGSRDATGDADTVNGFLLGGNDTIAVTFTGGSQDVYGDANSVGSGGVVIGGNDVITVVGASGTVRGDVHLVGANGNLIGGADTIYGGAQGDTLIGDAFSLDAGASARGGADTIHGGGGEDTIVGDYGSVYGYAVAGNDTIYGGAGNDTIYGDVVSVFANSRVIGGNDLLRGDAGNDKLDGGAGFDTASWQYGTGATINVATGTALDGEGGTDTFLGIEQYIGSAYYRDVFTAFDGVQYFLGMGGNDYVVDNGTGGGDVFNGGDGFDTIAFYNRNAATVNLANGTAIVDGLSNSIIAFEEVYGSNTGGDTIVGDDGANTFWGFGGSDVLVGGKGLDTLNGGLGNDLFGFNASDLQSGVWDAISDFHEVASTDRDILYFNGVPGSSLVVGEANGGVYVSTTALGGNGGVFIANFTAAQLSDQLMFT